MSLLIRSVDGEPLIEGVAEQVEHFSTALLAGSFHTAWLYVDDARIVLSDGRRTITYSIIPGWPCLPVNDDTMVRAEFVSDVTIAVKQ